MSDYYLLKSNKKNEIAPVVLLSNPKQLKALSSPLGWEVFKELSKPSCPMDIAKRLRVHEQRVYYYINKFKRAGLIQELHTEQRHGAVAKFFEARHKVFALASGEVTFQALSIKSPVKSRLLAPFVDEGRLNATIVVGSPDPHGPWKARASDACCAIDFALFLGSFTSGGKLPNYRLDIEVREREMKGNLVLIGGPTVNMITRRIRKRLPIYIDASHDMNIVSTVSKKTYTAEDVGIINVIENPRNRKAKILVLAGKRFPGTRAAILAMITKLEQVFEGNKWENAVKSRVVKGYDMDGDGIIDTAEFLE
ncbi:MAG: hypothetical protein JXC85_04940 [Candidatus Aenigmarchaeota archaeon]|nr:hypothetical protein [Candidatus Aenigmarchaeota archaeon]